jgi:hypothetical protein
MNAITKANVRKHDKFQYYADDCDCSVCLYYRGKSKDRKARCGLESCCCADIRNGALAAGRVKRPRGWGKCPE